MYEKLTERNKTNTNNPQLTGGKVDNSQFFLLDNYRQLVPTGVLGELYIAGDGI